jgi:hypothetical protein
MKILAIAPGTALPGADAGKYLAAYHDHLVALSVDHEVTVVCISGTSRVWRDPELPYGCRTVADRTELALSLPDYDLIVRNPLSSQAG